MHNLDIIKQRVQIEDLAERFGIQIANHKAKCPFHEDQDPSLQFYPDNNSFYCFGCATGGDIFNFIMLKEGCDFSAAVRYLCNSYGIPFTQSLRNYVLRSSKQYGLDFAYEKYKQKADHEKLNSWAKKRNIDIHTLQNNDVIFLSGNSLISQADEISRIEWEALCSAGVIFKNFSPENNNNYSQLKLNLGFIPSEMFYYPGVLFPVRNYEGDISGFAYRAEDPHSNKIPKYKYSRFFAKDENLWGIDHLLRKINDYKKTSKKSHSHGTTFDVFLVEGIMDAIRLQERGLNAVAVLGASLAGGTENADKSKKHMEIIKKIISMLKNHTVKFHIFLDNDSAGVLGAQKAFWKLLNISHEYNNFQFDYVFFSPKHYGKDPDEILNSIPESLTISKIKSHTFAAIDFLLSAEINVEPSELNDSWNNLSFWDKRNIISRLKDNISSKTDFDFNILLYYGFADDENTINENDASFYLIKEFEKHISHASNSPLPVIDIDDNEKQIKWGEAVQKARESYSTEDFPIDQAGWNRCLDGIDILREHLEIALQAKIPIEPYTPTVLPRASGESPRLLLLPSQEDLIIETAVLLEIFRYAYNHPGSIPITVRTGEKSVTYIKNSIDKQPTVSFAYQYNTNISSVDKSFESVGIFRHFSKCWDDYNDFIASKIYGVPENVDCLCYRLDIHRYYDSISSEKLSLLLTEIFSNELLEDMVPICPAIQKIVACPGQSKSEYANNFIQWIQKRTFSCDYYDPETWQPRSVMNYDNGIPQGPNLSAWLANIFLFDLDRKLHEACIKIHDDAVKKGIISSDADIAWYARYVDDIIIVAPDRENAEKLRTLIQFELEKKQLFLSVKIDEELIHGKNDLHEFIKKNRGIKSAPYGGDNFFYDTFDVQAMESAIWSGNLDRKNLLTYVYSDTSFEQAFNSPDRLVEMLSSGIYNSKEIRYRDYRRIASLVIYSVVNSNTDNYATKIVDCFFDITTQFLQEQGECKFEGLEKIYTCWQLFSIFEGIQKILVKRYDLLPSLTAKVRQNIASTREIVADIILHKNFLEQLQQLIVPQAYNTFHSLIELWTLSLKTNACLIYKDNAAVFENNRSDFVRVELGLCKNNLPTVTRPADDFLNKFRLKYIFTAFHILVHALKNNISITKQKLSVLFREDVPVSFKLLCEHQKEDDFEKDIKPLDVFNALSTFARTISCEEQFNALSKRHNLFCKAISEHPIFFISSPNVLQERYVLAFELRQNKYIETVKLVFPPDSDYEQKIAENIFPPDKVKRFQKEQRNDDCKLVIYKCDISTLKVRRYVPVLDTSKAKLLEIRKCFNDLRQYDKDLPHIVFSSQNLITFDENIFPLAWQCPEKSFDSVITTNNTISEVPSQYSSIIKAGYAALNAVGLNIQEHGNILEKIIREVDFDYRNPDWIFDFLIRESIFIFSGKICHSRFSKEIYLNKIKNFWSSFDEINQCHTPISQISCFIKFRFDDLRYAAEQQWESKIGGEYTLGKTAYIAQYITAHLLPSDTNFINYMKENLQCPSEVYNHKYSKRKNVAIWLMLRFLLKTIFKNSKKSDDEYKELLYAFELTAFISWIKMLSIEFLGEIEFFENKTAILAVITDANLEQGLWSFDDDIQKNPYDRLHRFVSLSKHFDSARDIEKITPAGWCVLACVHLSKRKFPAKEVFDILSENCLDSKNAQSINDSFSSNISEAMEVLVQWEKDNEIKIFENKGANPLNGSFRNYLGQETNLKPWQKSFSSLAKIDKNIEHEEKGNILTYFWSEAWYKDEIKSLSCISSIMQEYASLISSSPIIDIKDAASAIVEADAASDLDENKKYILVKGEDVCLKNNYDEKNLIDESLILSICNRQQALWRRRRNKANKDDCRIALLQLDIGHSSYCPIEEDNDSKDFEDNDYADMTTLSVKRNIYVKESKHIKKILEKALEVCQKFNVDILLLPEYSVHPEHINFIIKRLKELSSNLFVWAGTFKLNNKNAEDVMKKFCKDYETSPYNLFSSVLCVVSKDGVKYHRGKKYPSIAAKEDFSPWTEQIKPLFDSSEVNYSGRFVTELICSEIFMATSPANIKSLKWHHEMLRAKYKPKISAKEADQYKKELVVEDLLTFSENVGFCNERSRVCRRSILFIPAMTTRAYDFHILGKANFLAANLCSVFCNGVSKALKKSAPKGESCFIGCESTLHKELFPHTPYSGFEPGILSPNGTPLTSAEEALVIVDVDPFNMNEGKPRPQMLPRPLNLVAHIPFINLDSARTRLNPQKYDAEINQVLDDFVKLLNDVQVFQNYHNSKDLLKEKICNFWNKKLKNIIPIGNENIGKKFSALEKENFRNISTYAFSALTDIYFYKESEKDNIGSKDIK